MVLIIYVLFNFYWPPMHLRGNQPTLTDMMHIAWAIITISLMMLIMAFGAAALGRSFRIYTAITFIVFIVFGILIAKQAPLIPKNQPTPYLGLWERVNIGAFMVWLIMFAAALLRINKTVNTQHAPAYQE